MKLLRGTECRREMAHWMESQGLEGSCRIQYGGLSCICPGKAEDRRDKNLVEARRFTSQVSGREEARFQKRDVDAKVMNPSQDFSVS